MWAAKRPLAALSRRHARLSTLPDYRKMILESRVYDVAEETALQPAPMLSKQLRNTVLLKREDQQPVFSFKIRGAYNKLASLTEEQRQNGVVCCSAGNHAQGVALSARKLGVHATIVMPTVAPELKVRAVRMHGGDSVDIVLHGKSFDEAAAEAKRLMNEEGKTMLLPFDDQYVIAGQGTVGMEILQQTSGQNLDAIFVTCGGGGMLAGISAWVKQIRPSVKVIGVEASDAAGMTASLQAGQVSSLEHVGLFADGAAVKVIGSETYRVCEQYVDEMISVSTDEICAAIKDGFNDTRAVMEPAGVLALAGLKQYARARNLTNQTLVAVTSGANMDFARLRFVAERADSKERLVSAQIKETPGAFRHFHDELSKAGAHVTEFSYRYSDPTKALVHLSFRTEKEDGARHVLDRLEAAGIKAMDLTDNELAKVHTRYLAGGKGRSSESELLYRFEFPDRPGALQTFLQKLQNDWNISLFHYRNHGADVGRVLVGFQVPADDQNRFVAFLDQLAYKRFDETDNPVYKDFML